MSATPMRRLGRTLLCRLIVAALMIPAGATDSANAQSKRPRRPASKKKGAKPKKPRLPPLKTPQDKMRFLAAIREQFPARKLGRSISFDSEDLDKALEYRIGLPAYRYAPVVDDETFVRRAWLDLTGKVPAAGQVRRFVADSDPDKRSQLIDRLLESKDYARHWAGYWRTVIFFGSTANRRRVNPRALEDWLAGQFEKNVRWDRIVAEMVSAWPVRDKKKKNDFGQDHGPNNFVLACENKPPVLASQTARIFMGISIGCAECHDHPFDRWKREQFHELAAFFARGKYHMPGQDDPSKRTEMQPRFLLGEKPPIKLNPHQRRVALAAYLIYNEDNYWFARAFVNRIWSELLGDGFYPVDSLGPDQDAVHKIVINRLGALFRYRGFDPKWVFRIIMNSRTYQRDIRTLHSRDALFTAVRPSRMRAPQVLSAVRNVTGPNPNIARSVTGTFKVDPSVPQVDLEGSIQQALYMMNNRVLQARLRSSGLKKRLLKTRPDRAMIDELYLGVLARTPTAAEADRALDHLNEVPGRSEAIDDLMWVLVNSTEFITKR